MTAPRSRRRVHDPAIMGIEFLHDKGQWVVALETGTLRPLCTCQFVDFEIVREQALKQLGSELEPLTARQWLGLAADLVFERYEAMGLKVDDPGA